MRLSTGGLREALNMEVSPLMPIPSRILMGITAQVKFLYPRKREEAGL